ncbi:MAG: hypothetical protein HPPSJP_1190 [Candidatus Hepatoplasma scabrum]|nr:MAG: hypothetical protein HPPSJP_1190 [Candidatus Hepatoplasma sp.]
MILSKLINIDYNLKILINFTIIAFFTLIISLIIYHWYDFVFYSFAYSFLVIYFMIMITFLVDKLFKNKISVLISLFLFLIRIIIFLFFLFLAIYVINLMILDTKGVELIMKPINIFIYLLSYTLYYLALFLVPFYDWILFLFLKRKNDKNIKND